MADLERIKRNVAKMAAMNAPEADIDGYISSEGVTIDDVRNFKGNTTPQQNIPEWQRRIADNMVREGRNDLNFGEKAEAIGRGLVSGLSDLGGRVLNGATFGASDWATRKAGLDPTKGINEMIDNAKSDREAGIIGLFSTGTEMAGGFPTGGGLYKGVAKGLTAIPKVGNVAKYFAPAVSGAITGGSYGGFAGDSLEDAKRGAIRGAVIGQAFDSAGRVLNKALSAAGKIKGVERGFENAVKSDKGSGVLNRGIKESKDIAKQVYGQAPAAKQNINIKMTDTLDDLTRGSNPKGVVAAAKKDYADFLEANKSKQFVQGKFTPQQYQQNLKKWGGNDLVLDANGKPLVVYHGGEKGLDLLDSSKSIRSISKGNGLGTFFTSKQPIAQEYANIHNGSTYPVYMKMQKPFIIDYKGKYYYEPINFNDQNFGKDTGFSNTNVPSISEVVNYAKNKGYDGVIAKNIKDTVNSAKIRGKYVNEELALKKSLENMDFNDVFNTYNKRINSDSTQKEILNMFLGNKTKAKEYMTSLIVDKVFESRTNPLLIADDYVVFNPNQIKSVQNSGAFTNTASLTDKGIKPAPKVSDLGLNNQLSVNQKAALNKAWQEGANMLKPGEKIGSVKHIDYMERSLNSQINSSMQTNPNGVGMVSSNKTPELMELKGLLRNTMNKSGVEGINQQYTRAKSIEDAYNLGLNYKANSVKTRNLGFGSQDEKLAFAEGLFERAKMNPSNTNVSKDILANQDVLRDVLPKQSFESLVKQARTNSLSYERINSMENAAARKIGAAEPIGQSTGLLREWLDSTLAPIGAVADMARRAATANSSVKASRYLLNPEMRMGRPLYDAVQQYLPTSAVILNESKTKRKENK